MTTLSVRQTSTCHLITMGDNLKTTSFAQTLDPRRLNLGSDPCDPSLPSFAPSSLVCLFVSFFFVSVDDSQIITEVCCTRCQTKPSSRTNSVSLSSSTCWRAVPYACPPFLLCLKTTLVFSRSFVCSTLHTLSWLLLLLRCCFRQLNFSIFIGLTTEAS